MSQLTRQRCAKVIQRFYNTYIKAERDRDSGLPIDPISRDIIPKNRQLKLFITTNGIVRRIQYFDIYNLDTWFSARGEPVNPMTNVVFTRRQLADIRNCYNRLGLNIPNILENGYLPPDEEDIIINGDDEDIVNEQNGENDGENDGENNVNEIVIQNNILAEHFVYICSNSMAIDEILDILYTNTDNQYFNINYIRNIGHPLITTGTALMNAVLNDNLQIVEELLYFNPDLNISDSLYGYKAVDLAIIGEGENSFRILKILLFYGARLDIPTNYGSSLELTNDLEKLEILYNMVP
jgi:hypothetical protein